MVDHGMAFYQPRKKGDTVSNSREIAKEAYREEVRAEIEALQPQSDDEIIVRRGRKKVDKSKIIKTNLDLHVDMVAKLDSLAEHLNVSRQALIKVWINDKYNEIVGSQDFEESWQQKRSK